LYDANTAWLNHYARKFEQQGVETILIQGFSNASDIQLQGTKTVKDSLFETVCTLEFKNQKCMDEWYDRGLPDQRVNHMIKDNHKVLAEALASDDDVDLASVDWRSHILSVSTESMFKDQMSPKLLR